MRPLNFSAALGLPVLLACLGFAAPAPAPDFNREVRPILSRHCFKCHGPDEKTRMAGLRLDLREDALKPTAAGRKAIVAGNPEASELVRRVFRDGGGMMPPEHAKMPLSSTQKEALRRWVAAGAEYREHWAFVPPKRPALPKVKDAAWPRNPIDYFTLARMEAAGLKPSPRADRYILARRLYLDLIGLPPTPEEADAFVNDPAQDAYEKLVDRLLASPHYGERWARRWLDLARYADTNGYEKDRPRSIWPYRDWVIRAFNADMPFDRFTVEQLAGDMLPNATPDQRIATGFHRNTMLNEEGGIDPLEFRFHAMTDRVATTGTTWLGLTIGCAQCHTHKYDPIPHREYYSFMAFLNNADEPEIEVRQPEIAGRRAEIEQQAATREAALAERFPPEGEIRWHTPPAKAQSAEGATLAAQDDGSFLASGKNPERDQYTVEITSDRPNVSVIRLEALPDPSLGGKGPGRTPHGNFVLSQVQATVAPASDPGAAQPIALARAEADFSQDGFSAGGAIDGDPKTGWAIHGPGQWNVRRTLTLHLKEPTKSPGVARYVVRLDQQHGSQHTLGRFRVSLGERVEDPRPEAVRRKDHLERKFGEWLKAQEAQAVRWTSLRPAEAKSNLPLLTILDDASVLSSGDQTKRDVYDITLRTDLKGITALRLEALPDERLPKHGPGRVFYEGPHGDFFLSEVKLAAGDSPVKIAGAGHSFAAGGNSAAAALDGNPQTGWAINGGQGRAHTAVFNLAEPLADARDLRLSLIFERYFAAGMGRFRISVTTDTGAAAGLPPDVEAALTLPEAQRTAAQRDLILRHYLSVAPELAGERDEIRKLRASMPEFPTTLVFAERPPDNPRPTFLHHRGEFLQPKDRVEPTPLSVLHPFPKDAPRTRLTFARWLVDPKNPLVGRVVVNRHWAAFFGRGLVRTTEDFGLQGEAPSHPELLDYLAASFVGVPGPESRVPSRTRAGADLGLGWSLKELHRLIVTSATYQQASAHNPQSVIRNPQSEALLARGPRFRIEAELLRDYALKASGLLSPKMYGPSVFPPQPPGVTSEGTYGPLQWKVSEGEDRYRRGLYTFAKRTAPYAMFLTFDGPSGEACVARREVSNTPLQALTLLNDAVFVEAAQALGRMIAARPGTAEERAAYLYRRLLVRPPDREELAALVKFYGAQKARLEAKELDASAIAGAGEGDPVERAAWTLLARTLLNLDETVSKE